MTPPAPHLKTGRFSLLRSFVLADFLTLLNGACGTGSVLALLQYLVSAEHGWLLAVFVLLPLALVFDVLDGRIARWRRESSALGADLDSLADVISFGLAPAALGFAVGLRGSIDVAILIYFVACGISRLARFNVTADALSAGTGKVKYYEGTPIPTSVLIVGVIAALDAGGLLGERLWLGTLELAGLTLHPFALIYFVNGSAMISSVRIPKP